MVVLSVMILIKSKIFSLFLFGIFLFLNSCDSIESALGLKKSVIDDSQVLQAPELVIPPDFNEIPLNENTNSYSNRRSPGEIGQFNSKQEKSEFVLPETKNFSAPIISGPIIRSPSESIEKFQNKKSFTLGEWVFKQSVNNFKASNLFYIPNYDKGYNFSRRYFPNSNEVINNSNKKMTNQNYINNRSQSYRQVPEKLNSSQSLGELPILE